MHRILAVDDIRVNLDILTEMLGEAYEVRTADRGRAALALVDEFRPDLILLDVMMPDLDGLETCRELRRLPTLAATPIIMVSAKAMPSERARGLDVGADDYLTKPFDESELLQMIALHLATPRRAANAEPDEPCVAWVAKNNPIR